MMVRSCSFFLLLLFCILCIIKHSVLMRCYNFCCRCFWYTIGLGPATYFWVDTNSVPSDNGHRLYESITDTTNNNITTLSCGQQTLDAATGTSIYRIEFINGTTIQDYLSGCE